jgi:hypothetical protein
MKRWSPEEGRAATLHGTGTPASPRQSCRRRVRRQVIAEPGVNRRPHSSVGRGSDHRPAVSTEDGLGVKQTKNQGKNVSRFSHGFYLSIGEPMRKVSPGFIFCAGFQAAVATKNRTWGRIPFKKQESANPPQALYRSALPIETPLDACPNRI